jgi:hypothetical protein
MAIPRQKHGWRWLVLQTPAYDIGIAVLTALVGFATASNYWNQEKRAWAGVVAAATAGAAAFGLTKHVLGLKQAALKDSTHELEGCLYTLHAVLAPPEGCRLRLAVHVPIGDTLEQVTEYIGDSPKAGRIGRQYPANAGIIGKAYRERDVFVGRRISDDYEAYVQELVRSWNYTEERARKLSPGVREWMAVPFFEGPARVQAVLYLDATQSGFFTNQRQELVLAGVSGIAMFIGRRYTEASRQS